MRKSIIRVIAAALLAVAASGVLACSQLNSETTVRDLGFEVRGEIVWNADYMAYTLRLGLERGEDGQYALSYLIDGDPLVSLRTTGGGTLSSGETVELSTRESLVCILPTLSPGEQHSLRMEFTREGVSRVLTLELPDTAQKGIGIRIDTDSRLDFSRVILTNLMGASVTTYNVTFYLDGASTCPTPSAGRWISISPGASPTPSSFPTSSPGSMW